MQDLQNLSKTKLISLANEFLVVNNIQIGTQVELYTLQEIRNSKRDNIHPVVIDDIEEYFGRIATIVDINKHAGVVKINWENRYYFSPFWIKSIIHSEEE